MQGGAAVIVAQRVLNLLNKSGIKIKAALRDKIIPVSDQPAARLMAGKE
jgi:hypothetical protein